MSFQRHSVWVLNGFPAVWQNLAFISVDHDGGTPYDRSASLAKVKCLMKTLCLLTMLLATAVAAQNSVAEKPCISFVPESTSPTNTYAQDPLQSAVMMSGDFQFTVGGHDGCWAVHVLSLPVTSAKGKRVGYAISHTVTDAKGIEVGHALTFGPNSDVFVQAMYKAAADAIKNIRLSRSTSQSSAPPKLIR
jgi:hypothetical protein